MRSCLWYSKAFEDFLHSLVLRRVLVCVMIIQDFWKNTLKIEIKD